MSVPLVSFCGVVLAGGFSRRMGTDKALIEMGGRPLWRRQYELLAEAGAAERVISVRAGQGWVPSGIARIDDAQLDLGPLCGLVGALERSTHDHVLVLAVDLPRVPLVWFERLRRRCDGGRGAVGRMEEGAFEPLAAFYPRAMLPLARAALGEGRLALQPLVQRAAESGLLAVEPIVGAERGWFENWNEPSAISEQP